ncbi:retrotransposon protein, putative, ty1-copia subclass [Tanacetum coccineum]
MVLNMLTKDIIVIKSTDVVGMAMPDTKHKPFGLQELRSMFEKQARVEKFDLIQSFHACKQEEGKPVADYPNNSNPAAKELPAKDDACHHCKEVGHWKRNCPVYLAELQKKRKQVGSASSSAEQLQQDGLLKSTDDESFDKCESCLSGKMTKKPFPHSNERAKDLLGIIHTGCICGPLNTCGQEQVENQLGKTIKAIRSDRGGEYISQEFKDYLKANGIVQQLTPPYTPQHNWRWSGEGRHLVKRDTPDKLEQISVKCIFIGYPKETMVKISVGGGVNLEEIQEEEDTTPSEITSNIPQEVEGFEPPQEEVIPIRRSERPHRAPNRLCLNVEVEEHSLKGSLKNPASYKRLQMLDSESNKWIDAMNAEIQSMMDNMVWVLVDLPPGCKTVGSRWLFKKKTDMDGIVHVYKARLVAKGYTQLYGLIKNKMEILYCATKVLLILITQKSMQASKILMVLSKHQEAGIKDLMRKSKGLDKLKIIDEPLVNIKRLVGSNVTSPSCIYDIIIMEITSKFTPKKCQGLSGKCFAMKDLGEAAFILWNQNLKG